MKTSLAPCSKCLGETERNVLHSVDRSYEGVDWRFALLECAGCKDPFMHISRFRLHALQKAKRVERTNGDQFEAHHMGLTQGQLFEHFVSDGRIGHVDDERHARLSLERVPLLDLAIEVEVDSFLNFLRQDGKHLRLFKTGIDGPDGENFGCRCRFHSGPLCVCGIEAEKAADKCQCGSKSEFHVISLMRGARREQDFNRPPSLAKEALENHLYLALVIFEIVGRKGKRKYRWRLGRRQ